jgi:hypothetical protein
MQEPSSESLYTYLLHVQEAATLQCSQSAEVGEGVAMSNRKGKKFMFSNRIIAPLFVGIFISILITGCATTSGTGPGKTLTLDPNYKYKLDTIQVSDKENLEVDVEMLLRSALEKSLKEQDLLWNSADRENIYALSIRILNYDMGSAFKRWLLPGYGSTVLSVHTDVIDVETGKVLTYMDHRQTISGGGLFSAGAWKTVFNTVANDIAKDLERRYSGSVESFFIELDPWLEKESEVPKSEVTYQVHQIPLMDKRVEKNRIGERHALKVSMGNIYTNREVTAYLNEAIQNELLASGNGISESSKEITLSGNVMKFWVWTNSTPIYWDVNGEIEIALTAINPKNNKKILDVYKANSSSRTYLWPTKEIVGKVVSDAVKSLMYEIRKDRIWSKVH